MCSVLAWCASPGHKEPHSSGCFQCVFALARLSYEEGLVFRVRDDAVVQFAIEKADGARVLEEEPRCFPVGS
jgi:hypothetical protein